MLQRGIETPDMDVRWVSSLSWYFLNFFGLNGLYRLILGSDNCMFHPILFFHSRYVIAHVPFFPLLILPPERTRTPAPNPTGAFSRRISDSGLNLLCCAGQFHTRPDQIE